MGFLGACYGVAFVGGLATSAGMTGWYASLEKPAWTPPGSVIGGVWTVLFTLIAVAGWVAWREGGFASRPSAFVWFGVQLALNVLWSVLFFALRAPGWALVDLVALEVAIGATIVGFWRVAPTAGLLLVPYFVWVAFAGALNLSIWLLNV